MNWMSHWESLVDKKIREVIGDGDITHLPGAGEPLQMDEARSPEDMRMAYKIMKDHNVPPQWMVLAEELDKERVAILTRLKRYAKDYRGRMQDALRSGSMVRRRNAEDRWQEACDRLRDDTDAFNKKVLNYNLTVPRHIEHRVPLDLDSLIRQLP